MEINISQASKIFGVSRPTIYAMIERGEIPNPITAIAIMQFLQEKEKDLQEIQARLGQHLRNELEPAGA